MLRDIVLMSTGGVLLFCKKFKEGKSNPNMLGALLTAMVSFAKQKTGFPVSFIEFSTLALSLASDSEFGVMCAVFTDIEDGAEFAGLICKEILSSFVNTYSSALQSNTAKSSQQFLTFNVHIPEIIRGSVKPVLEELHNTRGVLSCALLSSNMVYHSTNEVDKVSLLANHQALMRHGKSLMVFTGDTTCSIHMQGAKTTLDVYQIEYANLIVKYKNAVNPTLIHGEITKRTALLCQILELSSNLQGQLDVIS